MIQPQLYDYGIQIEQSDIRCHVAPGTKLIFVFRTKLALPLLDRYPTREAYQRGVKGATSRGVVVPWNAIPDIRKLVWSKVPWWERFSPDQSTSEKGAHAVWVVMELLKAGRFPLWISGAAESDREEVQIKGADILLWEKWRIQVKCDYNAGPGPKPATGNIFLQIAERNPLKHI